MIGQLYAGMAFYNHMLFCLPAPDWLSTRCKTRSRQVTSDLPTPITLDATSPAIIPNEAATLDMPVTIASPVQEALAMAPDTPAMV